MASIGGTRDGDPIRQVADRSLIIELLLRFEGAARRGDPAVLSSVFTDDAVLDYEGEIIEGMEAIRGYFFRYVDKDNDAKKTAMTFDSSGVSTPFLGNVEITFEDDTAHCESSTLATHAGMRDGSAIVLLRTVHDLDDLVLGAEGWRICRRTHRRLWGFEVAGVLGTGTPPPPA